MHPSQGIRLPASLTTATHLDKYLVVLHVNQSDNAAVFGDRRINIGVQHLLHALTNFIAGRHIFPGGVGHGGNTQTILNNISTT